MDVPTWILTDRLQNTSRKGYRLRKILLWLNAVFQLVIVSSTVHTRGNIENISQINFPLRTHIDRQKIGPRF
jgi:hypothetical protein